MTEPSVKRNPIDVLATEFLERYRRGERPSLSEYAERFPDLAEDIRELFPVLLEMEQVRADDESGSESQPQWSFDKATVSRSPLDPSGTLIAGRYKLLEQIGEGGMGTVWMAQQTQPVRRRVAIKLVKPGMDSRQVLSRFEVERQALALMDHPNIAKVFDGGITNEGRPFFVMEYVKGMPITEYCDKVRLAVRERLKLFVQVCHAVQHAHQKGIIHRDLKPSNILICLYDGQPVPKVIDFGLAKAMHQSLTEHTLYTAHGLMVGTPLYMSPEQAEHNNLDVDTRSDLYSLGVVLYELLTGTTPLDRQQFKVAAWQEIVRLIKEAEPAKPSTRLSTADTLASVATQRSVEPAQLSRLIRGDLDWIVMKSLEKERSRRYETADGLARDIDRYLSDEAVEATPPTASYRFRKFARRNKAAFMTGGFVALALVIGTIVSTWQAIRATRAEQLAQKRLEETETARQAEADQRQIAEREKEIAVAERQRTEIERDEKTRQLYVSSMHLIERAWDENNAGRVRELLESQTPEHTGGVDLRGWEWSYRWRLCHSELRVLHCDPHCVGCLGFSPDGQVLVSGDWGGNLTMWNGDGSRQVRTFNAHGGRAYCLTFSRDGKVFATAGSNEKVKLWESATGRLLREFDFGGGWYSSGSALSPDGRYLAIATDDIVLWDTADGRKLRTFSPNTGRGAMAFNPECKRLIVGTGGGIDMWDVTTGEKIRTFGAGQQAVRSVVFHPDGKVFASGNMDGNIRSWDAQTGQELKLFAGHSGEINGLAFNRQGTRLVSASADATARIWDAATGRKLQTLKGHKTGLTSVAISPEDDLIATGGYDATTRLWDAASRQEPRSVSHEGNIANIAYSPENKLVGVVGEMDGMTTISVRDVAIGKEYWSQKQRAATLPILEGEEHLRSPLRFDPQSRVLALGTSDGSVHLWDAQVGHVLRTFRAHIGRVMSLDISSDGRTLATCGLDRRVALWDLHSGDQLAVLKGHTEGVNEVVFSPDGKSLLSGGGLIENEHDTRILLWNVATRQVSQTFSGHEGAVFALVFTRDGRQIVSGGRDSTLRWWDAATGRLLRSHAAHTSSVVGLCISPDGKRLASCSPDGTVKIWDVVTSAEVQTLRPAAGELSRVTFSTDGWRLAAVTRAGQVIVYDAQPRAEAVPPGNPSLAETLRKP